MKAPFELLNQLQGQISQLLPDVAKAAKDDFEQQAKATLMAMIARLDLVTREEFDAQAAVLMRTREMLQAMEARVAALEKAIQS